MAKALTVEWLDAVGASMAAPSRAPFSRVLICNLLDDALEPLRTVAPNAGDLADANYPGASKRLHFMERRLLLRAFVARCIGGSADDIRIFYDEHGAPRVGGADVYVSVSCRGERAALAVASSPVGVDLEPLAAPVPVIENVLGKRERHMLEHLSDEAHKWAFMHIWTGKEAYLKAVGRGFKREPSLVNIIARGAAFTVEDTGFPAALLVGGYTSSTSEIVACAVLP